MTDTTARRLTLSVALTFALALGCGSEEESDEGCNVTLTTHGGFSHDRTDRGACQVLNDRQYHYYNREVADWDAAENNPMARLVNMGVTFDSDDVLTKGGTSLPARVDLILNDGRVFGSVRNGCVVDVTRPTCGGGQARLMVTNVRCMEALPLLSSQAKPFVPATLTLDRLEMVSQCQRATDI